MHAIERSGSALTPRRLWATAWGFILLGAVGCGADAAADDPSTAEALLLFRDPSTSGPRLDVYDFDGHTAIAVSGPIGTEGMLSSFKGGDSLAELYRAVHPSVSTVPPDLLALDERIAPELAALRSAGRPPVDAAPATIEKSESSFMSNVCKTFSDFSNKYTPMECRWSNMGTGMSVGLSLPPKIFAGDRTYGWNHNATASTMDWYYDNGPTGWRRHPFRVNVPAFTWKWMSIGSGGPYWASIVGTQPVSAERGLTWHAWSPIIR